MKELNVNALCDRLSRAVEIAKVGDFKLCAIFEPDSKNAYDDYELIKTYYRPFFDAFVPVQEADMVVEVELNYTYATDSRTYETLADIQKGWKKLPK